jgi:hypothetical protein
MGLEIFPTFSPADPVVLLERAATLLVANALRDPFPPADPDADAVTVLIAPWYGTGVPVFSALLALRLARRGIPVTLLHLDLPYPVALAQDTLDWDHQFVAHLLRQFALIMPVETVSAAPALHSTEVEEIAREAAWADIQHRYGTGLVHPGQEEFFATGNRAAMERIAAHFAGYLAGHPRGTLLVPGGVANGSLMFTRLASSAGWRVPTYDSGPGSLVLSRHGVAGHLSDVRETFMRACNLPAARLAPLLDRARRELALRRQGRDGRMTVIPFRENRVAGNYATVLCMGREHDSAALALPSPFRDQGDWLCTTAEVLAVRLPGARMAVRQHPHERYFPSCQSADALARLAQVAAQTGNVDIYDAADDTDTYSLLEQSACLVTAVSTVGIEAAMNGLPTITIKPAYYSDLGFAVFTPSREIYADRLIDYARRRPRLDDVARDRAALIYVIIELCARIPSTLTPLVEALEPWLTEHLYDMDEDPFLNRLVDSLFGRQSWTDQQFDALLNEIECVAG